MSIRTKARTFVLGIALVVSALATVAPADAAVIGPSGDARVNNDLNCGPSTVFEAMPLVSHAQPGSVAYTVSEVLRYDFGNGRWIRQQWSPFRKSTINGYGSSTPVWTDFLTDRLVRNATYTVPGGAYLVRQWVFADGVWHARIPVTSKGLQYCWA